MSDRPLIVVVGDDPSTSDLYRHRLADKYEVETLHDRDEVVERVDDEVSVVLVERPMPDLVEDDLLTNVRGDDVDFRAALISSVRPESNVLEQGFDAAMVKPVSAEELNGTVETLLRRAEYEELLQAVTAIQSRRAELEQQCSRDELADHEEYRELTAEFKERSDRLEELADDLDDVDFGAVLHSLSW